MEDNKAVYELDVVKIKRGIVPLIKATVKEGYYKLSEGEKHAKLYEIANKVCEVYNVNPPTAILTDFRVNSYYPNRGIIGLETFSLISFLHELRHHLQREGIPKYRGLTIEQDSRAFSLKIVALATPKMFLKAVKEGKVLHVAYDETLDKVVDNCDYI